MFIYCSVLAGKHLGEIRQTACWLPLFGFACFWHHWNWKMCVQDKLWWSKISEGE